MQLSKIQSFLQSPKLFKIFLLVLFVILIGIRFLWLDKFPVGITPDDAAVILSAKSYWLKGTDISGTSFPMSLFLNNTKAGLSGLPSFLLTPIIGPFGLNISYIHFIYVVLNLITILFISLIPTDFLKKRGIFMFTIFVCLVNPWLFSYSRYPSEAPFALLFCVVSLYLIFKEKPTFTIWASIFSVLAFYSYFGAKVIVPLLFPLLLLFRFTKFRDFKNLKLYIFSFVIFLVLVGVYFLNIFLTNSSTFTTRSSKELVLSNISKYQQNVDELRRASINFPFENLVYNKYTFVLGVTLKKYTGWISSDFLFWGGDPVSIYRFGEHGVFYFVDLLLLLIGIAFIVRQKGKVLPLVYVLLAIALLAPIGSALESNGDSYFFRSFLLIPAWLIASGLGLYALSKYKIVLISAICVYLILFSNFLIFYFFRYPVKEEENQFLGERVVASYIERSQKTGNKVAFYATDPLKIYYLYLFYSNSLNEDTSRISNENLIYDGSFKITSNCKVNLVGDTTIYDSGMDCGKESGNYLVVQNQKDAGSEFFIKNDSICKFVKLDYYKRINLISDYSLGILDNQQFCNRWIFNNGNLKN